MERKLEEKNSSNLQKSSKSVDDFILLGAQPLEFRAEDLPEFNEEEKEEEEKNIGSEKNFLKLILEKNLIFVRMFI